MKKGFNTSGTFLISLLLFTPLLASSNYKSVLKKWTRHDRVYVLNNLEARLLWYATYLSEEFRGARRAKLANLYEWSDVEKMRNEQEDRSEMRKFDGFFLGIYSGSSQWPEIGKDEGKWRIVLQVEGREPVEAIGLERVPMTEVERALYPYLDKWSKTYLVKFPKTIQGDEKFRLRMTGIPARSELVWK